MKLSPFISAQLSLFRSLAALTVLGGAAVIPEADAAAPLTSLVCQGTYELTSAVSVPVQVSVVRGGPLHQGRAFAEVVEGKEAAPGGYYLSVQPEGTGSLYSSRTLQLSVPAFGLGTAPVNGTLILGKRFGSGFLKKESSRTVKLPVACQPYAD